MPWSAATCRRFPRRRLDAAISWSCDKSQQTKAPSSRRTPRIYLGGNSRGFGGGVSPLDCPVWDITSLIAPKLDNIADVSTGMKITFELLVLVMSRRLSI
jgi:hypothetical protein